MKELKIIFEDDDLLVAEKPEGLLTMSTGKSGEVTAYTILTARERQKNRDGRIFIVHRLDRDTSGLLIFAKTWDTKRALQDYWDQAVLERKYVALVEGRMPKPQGTTVSWLRENPKSFKVTSSPVDDGGQRAVTHYKVLEEFGPVNMGRVRMSYSLVEFELETGRKNQIRVHAASLGNPVAGDEKYGAQTNPAKRLALHARTITFIHPWTCKTLSLSSDIPRCFFI